MSSSFDLFDTLAAARHSVRAGDPPVEDHISIAETVASVTPEDVVVSDFDDEAKARRVLTEVCGLSNRLVVTPDGKATGKVWKTVQSDHHTGDNVQSDFDSPRRAGIRANIVQPSLLTARERACGPLGWVMREARLRTCHVNPKIRALQRFQIERNFPFLMKAAELINQKMRAEGFERLLLCSRDCFLLYQLMRRLYSGYKIEYFFTSRVTRYRPPELYREYAREKLRGKTLIVDLTGSGSSLKHLTDTFGGTPLLVVSSMDIVPSLTRGSILETANQAPHPMIVGVANDEDGTWCPVGVNPTGQNWTKPEIIEAHDAFRFALECLPNHNVTSLPYSLADSMREMAYDSALAPLWEDHLADSKAAYQMLNAGPLPHRVIL